jgi:predicted transcriptional regulator
MSKYRSKTEIISAILTSIIESNEQTCPKTKIMYKAFLSYQQMNDYLNLLALKDLVKVDDKEYTITEKGKQFLSTARKINSIIDVTK